MCHDAGNNTKAIEALGALGPAAAAATEPRLGAARHLDRAGRRGSAGDHLASTTVPVAGTTVDFDGQNYDYLGNPISQQQIDDYWKAKNK